MSESPATSTSAAASPAADAAGAGPSSNGQATTKLGVFISYSRDDVKFADQLLAALTLCGYTPTIDRSTPGGVAWQENLQRLILQADTVIFIVSPDSLASRWCAWEVKQAASLGKRIVPVVCRPLGGAKAPDELGARNYVYFYEEADFPGSGFGMGMVKLVEALRHEPDWLREHTWLLQRASEWLTGGRPANRLLSGDDIMQAKLWAARRPADAPPVTAQHLDYIRASEEFERQQQSEARRRLAEREGLVRERETAQADRDRATRALVRRTVLGAAVAVLLAVVAGLFAYQSSRNFEQAVVERDKAERNAKEAGDAKHVAEQRKRDADQERRKAGEEARNAKRARDRVIKYVEQIAAREAERQAERVEPLMRRISTRSFEMIVRFETGGRDYYERVYKLAPVWPGYSSGVTIGMGYDLGYVSEDEFRRDWGAFLIPDDFELLRKALGVTGEPAKALLGDLKDIVLPFVAAEQVFKASTLPKFLGLLDRALPNAAALPPDCVGALLSLVFNRGADFRSSSDRRSEMRNVRAHVEAGAFERVAAELRDMKRHWTSKGLQQRRDEEAELFDGCAVTLQGSAGAIARGMHLLREGDDDAAASEFTRVLQADPSLARRVDEAAALALIARGSYLMSEGSDAQAEARFAAALARDAGAQPRIDRAVGEAVVAYGQRLLEEGRTEEARKRFEGIVARMPATRGPILAAYIARAKSLEGEGKLEPARTLLAEALRIAPDSRGDVAKVHVTWGGEALNAEEPDKARQHFARALEVDPGMASQVASAIVSSGERMLLSDEPERAASYFAMAAGYDAGVGPSVADAFISHAAALLTDDKEPEARAQIEKALGHDQAAAPRIAVALYEDGKRLLEAGRRDEASARFAAALGHDRGVAGKIDELWQRQPRTYSVATVAWHPDDSRSPDYRHLARELVGSTFELRPDDLDLLIRANRFAPVAHDGRILFALRGAELLDGPAQVGRDGIRLRDVRPDHRTFRCVIGVYDLKTRKLSAFIASTVPNRTFVYEAWRRHRDGESLAGNIMPAGSYGYIIGPHNRTPGAFLARASLQQRRTVAVFRSVNDVTYDIEDLVDVAQPGNNVHPAFTASTAEFSSAGSLTVRGSHGPAGHTGEWAELRVAAGLPRDGDGPTGARIDLMLMTGLEAAIAADLRQKGQTGDASLVGARLERLRQGSKGPQVERLRAKLGLPAGDEFDAATFAKLAEVQREKLGFNDGILSPEVDRLLGLCVLGGQGCSGG